jgi:uncharacterized membrane protein YkoI
MTNKLKNILLGVFAAAALALGGSAIAGAASSGNNSNSTTQSAAALPALGAGGQRPDESLLSGNAAEQVRAAALEAVAGATIERVETDADGNAKYEAHITKADGSRATVYVDASFDVVSVESGH